MATENSHFVFFLPWIIGAVVIIVCIVGLLIANRDIGK